MLTDLARKLVANAVKPHLATEGTYQLVLHADGEDPIPLGRTNDRSKAEWLATIVGHLHLTDARIEVRGVTYEDADADMVTLASAADVLTDALSWTAARALAADARETFPGAAYIVLDPRGIDPGYYVVDILDHDGGSVTALVGCWPREDRVDDHAAHLVDGRSWRDLCKVPKKIDKLADGRPVLNVADALDLPPTTTVAASLTDAWVHLQTRSALADQYPIDDASPVDRADAAEQNAAAAQLLQRLVDALLPH